MAGEYTAPRYMYLPDGWDDCWRAAKAASERSVVQVLAIGDSVTVGANGADFNTDGWLEQVRTWLLSRNDLGGDYWPTYYSADYRAAAWSGTPPFVVSSGSGRSWTAWGLPELAYFTSTPAAGAITFTTPYACGDLDVLLLDGNPGTWEFTVDGWQTGVSATGGNATASVTGVAGTTATIQVTNVGGYRQKRVTVSGLSHATHTVTFGNQSATSVMMPMGVATYLSRSAGLAFARMATYGRGLDKWALSSGVPSDRIQLLQGKIDGGTLTGFGFPTQPHLALLAVGVNDCGGSMKPAAFRQTLDRFCRALRRGRADCSIVFHVNSNPNAGSSDLTSGNFTDPQNWLHYVEAMQACAERWRCAVVNTHERWGETPVAAGFMASGNAHPTLAGHSDIAEQLKEIL
jgi:lysophospholipase L1-like esterase